MIVQLLARFQGLEEERDQLSQAQSETGQLMAEFFASVSAADDAAVALSELEGLSQRVEELLATLVPEIQTKALAAQNQNGGAGEDLRSEQLRVLELEMELEERSKEADNVKNELDILTAKLEQLATEKAGLEEQVI